LKKQFSLLQKMSR